MKAPIANADQASSWDGDEGEYWLRHEDRYNFTLRDYGARLHAAAQLKAGENVLDIGCGCGDSTRMAARAVTPGRVLGVDLSARMLERGRERAKAEGLDNVRFEQADAQVHAFEPDVFDVAISRFGSMFFSDPPAAFRNINRALKDGGRLTLLVWRGIEHNEWVREMRKLFAPPGAPLVPPPCAPGPLGLSDPDLVRPILSGAGFVEIEFEAVSGPMRYGRDTVDALGFVKGFPLISEMLRGADEATKAKKLDALASLLESHRTPDGVQFASSAWSIRALRARKSEN